MIQKLTSIKLGDNQLSILIFISSIGLGVSFIIHFCWLFNVYSPPKLLAQTLYIFAVILVYIGIISSAKARRVLDKSEIRKTLSNTCPRWITVTGFLTMYAVAMAFVYTLKNKTGGPISDDFSRAAKGLSAFWMFLYSWAILLFYFARSFFKEENEQNSDVEDISPNERP